MITGIGVPAPEHLLPAETILVPLQGPPVVHNTSDLLPFHYAANGTSKNSNKPLDNGNNSIAIPGDMRTSLMKKQNIIRCV